MGEAIITSRGGSQEDPVPVVPGYHSILVTLRDYQGKLLKDYPINCKDGSVWYNYKTNETGKALFTCNSGSANISTNNVVDGYRYLDIPNHIMNCDAPIGGQTRLAFNIPKTTTKNFSFGAGTSKIRFMHNQECSGYIVGGGGGGTYYFDYYYSTKSSGGGGGYLNYINNCIFKQNENINIVVGFGGAGKGGHNSWTSNGPGGSGQTSYISNYPYSANGGQGGNALSKKGGIGFGNGGYCDQYTFIKPTNSGSSLAGGGGGATDQTIYIVDGTKPSDYPEKYVKGYPFGGLPAYYTQYSGGNVTRAQSGGIPGGGGAGGSSDNGQTGSYSIGGAGGNGICKLNMVNY